MEPFQLLCPGCASKLKVRNRSAIGQRLACPKCREMILVEAPEGHDIGESQITAPSFDDMDLDALLDNRAAEARKPPPAAQKPKQFTAEIIQPKKVAPVSEAAASQTPTSALAPGEEWVNPATKNKQRLVLLAMAAIGALILIGGIATFLFNGLGKENEKVAELPTEVKAEDVASNDHPPPMEVGKDELTEPEIRPDESPAEDSNSVEVPEIGDAPPIMGVPDAPPTIPGTEPNSDVIPEGFGSEAHSEEANTATDQPATDKRGNEIEKIKSALAESGTSLLEIQSAASSVKNDAAIGTPKYFFEKSDFESGDPSKRKDQILLGVKYEQQTLQTVLHELAAISGLQLTIDVPSIASVGAELNPKIDLQVQNESTGSVVRKIAQAAGLFALETDQGFLITVEQSDDFKQESISVVLILENPNDGNDLVQLIRNLVYPGTWQSDPEQDTTDGQPKGTIEFANGKLELNHNSAVIRECQKLIDGIKAASRNDGQASKLLQPVPWLDGGSFTKPVEPSNSIRSTIGKFFRDLGRDHNIQIFGDWHSLGQAGWSSDAMAPGRLEERTAGDVVKQTAHGLGASFYIVDKNSAWITSPAVANNIFLLKLYKVEKLASGRLSSEHLSRILSDSLGSQLNQVGVAVYVLPSQKLIAVRASQSLHRQIRVVFEAIE